MLLSDAVTVAAGDPTLLLSDGAVAAYDPAASNPSAGRLVFDYTVGANDRAADLTVAAVELNGAAIHNADGVGADLSGADQFELGLAINVAVVSEIAASGTGDLTTGDSARLTVTMSESVAVNTSAGSPTFSLSDGATATYDTAASKPASGTLVFDYLVGSSDYTTDLQVSSLNLNGSTITDSAGASADASNASGHDLALDVNAAVVTAVAALPASGEASASQTVKLTLTMSEPVTVDTAGGSPTLGLNDGETATYDAAASAPSAGTLIFDYKVGSGDETPSLQVAFVNLNGATINDANGNAADLNAIANFSTSLQIGAAYVASVTTTETGDVSTGQGFAITVVMSQTVAVDVTGGAPTLALSDGATATYDAAASNLSNGSLVFNYAVGKSDYTTDLQVDALDLDGATIKDANNVAADVSAAAGQDLALDVNADVVTAISVTPASGEASVGQTVAITLKMSGPVTVNTAGGLPTLSMSDGATASYVATASDPATGTLVFNYVVEGGNRTAQLQVEQANLNGAAINDLQVNAADISTASDFGTNLQVGAVFVSSASVSLSGEAITGENVRIALSLSEGVTVDTTNGSPTLTLSDGATATYNAAGSAPGAGSLVFDYLVGASDYTSDLQVSGLALGGALVGDSNRVAVDVSAAAGQDLAIDVNAAIVTAVATSQISGEAGAGQTVTITLTMSEAVTVSTTHGSPTLRLNDGATATYDAAASTPSAGTLVFDYKVRATDETVAVAVAQLDLNGASIVDGHGDAADFGAASSFLTTLQIGPAFVSGIDASREDELLAGQTVEIALAMSQAVTVNTSGGSPTLTLSDGATATYDAAASDPTSGLLTFDYTVAAADHSSDLRVYAANLDGSTIDDLNGVAVDLTGAAGEDLALDVNATIVTALATSPGSGVAIAGQTVTLTLTLNHSVTVDTTGGSPTLALNDGAVATYDAKASNPPTASLVFNYVVGASDQTSDLGVSQVKLNGSKIDDAGGNAADMAAVANLSTNLQIGASAGALEVRSDSTGTPIGAASNLAAVAVGQSETFNLDLVNVGTGNLVLTGLTGTAGSGFTFAPIAAGTVIAPGAAIPLAVTFDPRGVGAASTKLQVSSNDPNGPTHLTINGFGESATPFADVTRVGDNNLGGAAVSSDSAEDDDIFTVSNSGAQPLVISAIELTSGAGDFTLTGLPAALASGPITLGFGQSVTFGAKFKPVDAGLDQGVIDIVSNEPNNSSDQVDVVGTGLSASLPVHWGDDYVSLNTGSGPERLLSDATGEFQYFMPANSNYQISIFDPVSGMIATGYGATGPSGTNVNLTEGLVFTASRAPDPDYDGLPDDVETTVGTNPDLADSAVAGIPDSTALREGLLANSDIASKTGVVASVVLKGNADAVVLAGSTSDDNTDVAYVATGSFGLAIVDVSDFLAPTIESQLQLGAGSASDVSVDSSLMLAAVADGPGGLDIIDVSNPTSPKVTETVSIDATAVVAYGGVAYTNDGSSLAAIDLTNGQVLQRLALGGSNITSLARAGTTLYAMDSSDRLSAFDISQGYMVEEGGVDLPVGGGRITVGDGVVYVPSNDVFSGGFATVDVSNPTAPHLIATPQNSAIESAAMALNGSGLAVTVGQDGGGSAGVVGVDVVNVSDATNTKQFENRYTLKSQSVAGEDEPFDIAIGDGTAFVADGNNGLQVIDYLPFDTQGVAPTIDVTQQPTDVDLNTPGIQVIEGSTVTIGAAISDDVQVRNVEVLVDGQVQSNSVSYPWSLEATLPTIAANGGSNQATIEIEAIDTGGNTTVSTPIDVELVPDTTPPTILSQNVADDSVHSTSFRSFRLVFSKSLDASSVTASDFSLVAAGGAALSPSSVELSVFDKVVEVDFPTLSAGAWTFDIDSAGIMDRAGNALGASTLSTSFGIAAYTTEWIGGSGDWSSGGNWSSGLMPTALDVVQVNLTSGETVTVSSGANAASFVDLLGSGTLALNGGVLTVYDDMTLGGGVLQLNGGGEIQHATLLNQGGGLALLGGTLDDVTYQGALDLTQNQGYNNASVHIADGITLQGSDGQGSGAVNLGNYDAVYFDNTETIDGATLSLAGYDAVLQQYITYAAYQANNYQYPSETLTFGANLVVDHTTSVAYINSGGDGSGAIDNEGLIKAEAGNGSLYIQLASFLNDGAIDISDGDTVYLENFTNEADGSVTVETGSTAYFGWNNGSWSNAGTITVETGATAWLAGAWTDAGTLTIQTGVTLHLGGVVTLAELATYTAQGESIYLDGTLDLGGQTLTVGAGGDVSKLYLASDGSISDGTIQDLGSGLDFEGGALSGVTYQGTLDLTQSTGLYTGSSLYVSNTLTATGAGGAGSGSLNLGGNSAVYFDDTQTIDNATIALGGSNDTIQQYTTYAAFQANSYQYPLETLTFGPNLVIGATGTYATINSGGDGFGVIDNRGQLNADASGGSLYIDPNDFINDGAIDVSNGDTAYFQTFTNNADGTVTIESGSTAYLGWNNGAWTNDGTITLKQGGSLHLGGSVTAAVLDDINNEGGAVYIDGTYQLGDGALHVGPGSAHPNVVLAGSIAGLAPAAITASTPVDLTSLKLLGSAAVSGSDLQLTDDYNQAGAGWQSGAVSTTQSFETEFTFTLQKIRGDGTQADGIAFVAQPEGDDALGSGGGDLGLSSISPAAAAVFQSWTNNHVGLVLSSNPYAAPQAPVYLGAANLATGDAVVAYDANAHVMTMTVNLDLDGVATTLDDQLSVDLSSALGSSAYLGFTGGTANGRGVQSITSWSFADLTSSPLVHGTIVDPGSGMTFKGGTLDGVTYEGALDLTPEDSSVYIADGMTATGADGAGPGAINLADGSSIDFNDTQTFDNATITLDDSTLGQNTTYAAYQANGYTYSTQTLTLGPNLIIDHTGDYGYINSVGYGYGTIDNEGKIEADAKSGSVYIEPTNFINDGAIDVSNGDSVYLHNFTNAADGTLTVGSGSSVYLGWNGGAFVNAGQVVVQAGGAVHLGGTVTLAALSSLSADTSSIYVDGSLDLGGQTLSVGPGAALTKLYLDSGATISNGTIDDLGSGMEFRGGTLDDVIYEGALDLTQTQETFTGSTLYIANTLTATGAGGTGDGALNFGDDTTVFFDDTQTVDNATITLGGNYDTIQQYTTYAAYQANGYKYPSETLTFGPDLVIDQTGTSDYISSGGAGTGIVDNQGQIDAEQSAGSLYISPANFINEGEINVSNGDALSFQAFTNDANGTLTVASGSTVYLGANNSAWANAGTITLESGSTAWLGAGTNTGTLEVQPGVALHLTGQVTIAEVLAYSADGATVYLDGTLDLGGATLTVGPGSALPNLSVEGDGTISDGAIQDLGSGLIFQGGTLDDIVYQGTLDLTPSDSSVIIEGSFALTDAGGAGPWSLSVGNQGTVTLDDARTLDGGTIKLDGDDTIELSITYAAYQANGYSFVAETLTFGANLVINQTVGYDVLTSYGYGTGTIDNKGQIDAEAHDGSLYIEPGNFINDGAIDITNGDTVYLQDFTNAADGAITVAAGSTGYFGWNNGKWTNAGTITLDSGSTGWIVGAWSSSGTLTVQSGVALHVGGTVTLAELATYNADGATLYLGGSLDLGGQTLSIGPGGALPKLYVGSGAILSDGVIEDLGSSVIFQGGTLSAVTYEGAIELTTPDASVYFTDGLSATGADGTGAGAINLGAYASVYLADTQTIDNATITLGGDNDTLQQYTTYATYAANGYTYPSETVTLGSNVVINQTGDNAYLNSGGDGYGTFDNKGQINAEASRGSFYVDPYLFTNDGAVDVSNGDTLDLQNLANEVDGTLTVESGSTAYIGWDNGAWTNAGTIDVQFGGTLIVGGAVTLSALLSLDVTGTLTLAGSLDLGSKTLSVGSGGVLAALQLGAGATLSDGTVEESSAGLIFRGGSLDNLTYAGVLDLTPAGSSVHIADGLTATGVGGAGPGALNLGDSGAVYFDDTQTFDDATITLGGSDDLLQIDAPVASQTGVAPATIGGGGGQTTETLTLGADLVIDQTGASATIGAAKSLAGEIDNLGAINAEASGGSLTIDPDDFINDGAINVSNSDALTIGSADSTFVDNGIVSVAGASALIVADVKGSSATAEMRIADNGRLELAGAENTGGVRFENQTAYNAIFILDHAATNGFSGAVSGFDDLTGSSDQIVLQDIAYEASDLWTYSQNSSTTDPGGVLTVTDAAQHTASLTLLGQYLANGASVSSSNSTLFALAADSVTSTTGTLLTTNFVHG